MGRKIHLIGFGVLMSKGMNKQIIKEAKEHKVSKGTVVRAAINHFLTQATSIDFEHYIQKAKIGGA